MVKSPAETAKTAKTGKTGKNGKSGKTEKTCNGHVRSPGYAEITSRNSKNGAKTVKNV